jgi:PAS domain S-box-containing protein
MLFFLAGYLSFLFIKAGGNAIPTEVIIGPVFLGGALFVFIMVRLSGETIGRVDAAKEELRRSNELLEQRVLERTRELERSRDFHRSVVNSLNEAVSIIDVRDHRIVSVNSQFLRELGLTEDEVLNRACYEATHDRRDICTPPHDRCPLIETLGTGKYAVEEHVHVAASGEQIHVEVSTTPVRDQAGAIYQVIHVSRDISVRKRAEERLRRLAEDLTTGNEELMSFIYSVSHDLRAPLVNLRGFSGELERSLLQLREVLGSCPNALPPAAREQYEHLVQGDIPEALSFISSSASRMDGLINAMLKLSRLGRREIRPEVIDTESLMQFLIATFAHQIEQKQATVSVGPLPQITADRMALEQILGNLLDNALKYLVPERPGVVTITAEQAADGVLFHVQDNGRGMAKNDIATSFELFRRIGKQDVPGEGMGLSYAKALVRRHGGRLWCDSEPGKGSTFSFSIPREVSVPAEEGIR